MTLEPIWIVCVSAAIALNDVQQSAIGATPLTTWSQRNTPIPSGRLRAHRELDEHLRVAEGPDRPAPAQLGHPTPLAQLLAESGTVAASMWERERHTVALGNIDVDKNGPPSAIT